MDANKEITLQISAGFLRFFKTTNKMKNQELIQQAIGLLADNQQAADLLRRFLLSNAKNPGVKFDFYNYVSRDYLRPAMMGVLHQNGFKVATNGHVMIALAEQQYDAELEGCIIDSKANKINERYVDWRRVIPAKHTMNVSFVLDIDKIRDAVKIEKQLKKEKSEKKVAIKLGVNYFNPEMLLKIAIFASQIGVNELKMNDLNANSPACIYGEDGSIGLIMPLNITKWKEFEIIEL